MKIRKKLSPNFNKHIEFFNMHNKAWRDYPKERKLILKIFKLKLKESHIFKKVNFHKCSYFRCLYRRNKVVFLFGIVTQEKGETCYQLCYYLYINHKNQLKLFQQDIAYSKVRRSKTIIFTSIDSLIAFLSI